MIVNGYEADVSLGFSVDRNYFLRFTPDLSGLRDDEDFTEEDFARTMRSLESTIYRDLHESYGWYPRYCACARQRVPHYYPSEVFRLDPHGPTIIDITAELWAVGAPPQEAAIA